MLAKFGITSPFNKRKVKEQMLQKHQQLQFQQQQQQHQAQQIQQHHVSSIPTPKKLTFSTNSALPVYQTALNGSSNTATNSNLEVVYQSQISRFKQNNQQICTNSNISNDSSSSGISSNKTTSTSSRASSPTVSNYGGEPNLTNSAAIHQEMPHNTTSTTTAKTGSKLAQIFQQNSSKLMRKSSLSKPSVPINTTNNNNTMTSKMSTALPQSTQFHSIQQPQQQQQQSAIPAVNNKISTSSKLQAPGTISLNNQQPQAINNCSSITSDTSKKTVKKISNNNNTNTIKSIQMPSAHVTPACLTESQLINKSTNIQTVTATTSTGPNKQKSLTFGLPKLTKLNMNNSNNNKNSHSDQKSNSLVQTSQSGQSVSMTQPIYATSNNNNNQINVSNTTSNKLMYTSKSSQLKTPSVQINKPQMNEQPSANVVEANSTEMKLSQTATTATSKLSKMPTQIASKLSSNKSAIQTLNSANKSNVQSPTSTDQTQLSTFQSPAQVIRLKPTNQAKIDSVQQDAKPNETNNVTSVSLEEKDAKKPVCNELSNTTDDEVESLNLDDLSNERLIDDNDEEFQKFLNSPEENSNYINNSKAISMTIVDNKSVVGETNRNDVNSSLIFNNKLNVHTNESIYSSGSRTFINSKLNSPPLPSPPSIASLMPSSLLSPTHTNNTYMTSSLSHSRTNPASYLNLNSFGRSNTLDRKLKPINDFDMLKYSTQRNSLNIQHIHSTATSSSYYQPFNRTLSPPESLLLIDNANGQTTLSSSDLMSQSKLLAELDAARNRAANLTNQLNANSQIVYTLEQTISSLTGKIQALSLNLKKKDNTITELKHYIEQIHLKYPKILEQEKCQLAQAILPILIRHHSTESLNSLNSVFSQRSTQSAMQMTSTLHANASSNEMNNFKKRGWLRSSFSRAFGRKSGGKQSGAKAIDSNELNKSLENKKCLSDVEETDSISSQNQSMKNCAQLNESHRFDHLNDYGEFSLPNSPLHNPLILNNHFRRKSINNNNNNNNNSNQTQTALISLNEDMEEYEKIIRDKEAKLTDIRLEALATAHQLDQSKEENMKIRIEMEQLRNENIRMQQMLNALQQTQQQMSHAISSPSPSSSVSSSSNKINLSLSNSTQHVDLVINNSTSSSSSSSSSASSVSCSMLTRKFLNEESVLKSPTSVIDKLITTESNVNDAGKRVFVKVHLGEALNPLEDLTNQITIGSLSIGTRTNWDNLDSLIKELFKNYLIKLEQCDDLDPRESTNSSLGLDTDSIHSYFVGDMPRLNEQEQKVPDLLPYGYLVGDHTSIILKLKDAAQSALDFLCYDTLVPKNVMQRYISLLLDFKNLLFCGPNGTNKSYIARKIAEHLVKRHNKSIETSIAYFNVENKSSKELKQYLNNIVDLLSPEQIPFVLILDNLHFISNMSDTFTEYFSPKNSARKCTFIIGTLNQPNVTSLNLHPNFKWVLCLNHTEPVKGFLNRHLQRRLIDNENKGQISVEMEGLISWIPKLWSHVNKYIELYNSPDMTLGPKLFLTFPMDMRLAQNWFIHLWNELLVPLLIDIIKEGVQVYGPKVKWEDPKNWLKKTLPWNLYDSNVIDSLYSIESHHVDYYSDDESRSNELLETNQLILEESIVQANKRQLEVPKSLQLVPYPNSPTKVNLFTTFGRSPNTNALTTELNPKENDKLFNMLVKLQEATLNQKS